MTTSIEWTDETWNPTRGCSLVSPGCTNCYAMKQAHRFAGEGKAYEGLTRLREAGGPVWTGIVRAAPEHVLELPLTWHKPRRIFVDSMSDLFHEDVADDFITAVFGIMAECPQHTFQVLTKRADRMRSWFQWLRAEAPAVHGCERDVLHRHLFPYLGDASYWQRPFFAGYDVHAPGARWPLPNVWLCAVLGVDEESANA